MNFDLLTVVTVVVIFILLGRENKKGRPHFQHVGCFQTDVELAYRVYPPHMGLLGFGMYLFTLPRMYQHFIGESRSFGFSRFFNVLGLSHHHIDMCALGKCNSKKNPCHFVRFGNVDLVPGTVTNKYPKNLMYEKIPVYPPFSLY